VGHEADAQSPKSCATTAIVSSWNPDSANQRCLAEIDNTHEVTVCLDVYGIAGEGFEPSTSGL